MTVLTQAGARTSGRTARLRCPSANFGRVVVRAYVGGNGDGRSGQERRRREPLRQRGVRIPVHPSTGSPLPAAARSLEPGEERVKQALAPNRTGSSVGRPVSSATCSICPSRVLVTPDSGRVERDARDRRLARREARCARGSSTKLPQRRDRSGRGNPRSRSRRPHGRARSACGTDAVHEPERHARVHGMHERALTLDEQELAAAARSPRRRATRRHRRESRRRLRPRRCPSRRSRCPSDRSGRRPTRARVVAPRGRARPRPSSSRSRSRSRP